MNRKLKIWLACPGLGHINRGFESFTSELFTALQEAQNVSPTLFVGGRQSKRSIRLPTIRRGGKIAQLIVWVLSRRYHEYEIEQITFAVPLILLATLRPPDIIMVSDVWVASLLFSARKRGLFRTTSILFSNGAPCQPPFWYADVVQHLTPTHYSMALSAGEDPNRHMLIPYGFDLDQFRPDNLSIRRLSCRNRFGIPQDAKVILSVGLLSAFHKRMNYVIEEIADLSKDYFLLLVGERASDTLQIKEQATELLGDRFRMFTLAHEEMPDVFAVADLFALASLAEGFGRVVVEAMAAGLPLALHDSPTLRFVANDDAFFGNFALKGELRNIVYNRLEEEWPSAQRNQQSQRTVQRFSWRSLLPEYLNMFNLTMKQKSNTK